MRIRMAHPRAPIWVWVKTLAHCSSHQITGMDVYPQTQIWPNIAFHLFHPICEHIKSIIIYITYTNWCNIIKDISKWSWLYPFISHRVITEFSSSARPWVTWVTWVTCSTCPSELTTTSMAALWRTVAARSPSAATEGPDMLRTSRSTTAGARDRRSNVKKTWGVPRWAMELDSYSYSEGYTTVVFFCFCVCGLSL